MYPENSKEELHSPQSSDPEDTIQPPKYHVVTEGYDPKQINIEDGTGGKKEQSKNLNYRLISACMVSIMGLIASSTCMHYYYPTIEIGFLFFNAVIQVSYFVLLSIYFTSLGSFCIDENHSIPNK